MPSSEENKRSSREIVPFITGMSPAIENASGFSTPDIIDSIVGDTEKIRDEVNFSRNHSIGGQIETTSRRNDNSKIEKSLEMLIGINFDQLDVLKGIEETLKNPKRDIEKLESIKAPSFEEEKEDDWGVSFGNGFGDGWFGNREKKDKKGKRKNKNRNKKKPKFRLGLPGVLGIGAASYTIGSSLWDAVSSERKYSSDIKEINQAFEDGEITREERDYVVRKMENEKKRTQSGDILSGIGGGAGAFAGGAVGAKTLGSAGALFGPVGALAGTIVGGIGGSILGAMGGESIGDFINEKIHEKDDIVEAERDSQFYKKQFDDTQSEKIPEISERINEIDKELIPFIETRKLEISERIRNIDKEMESIVSNKLSNPSERIKSKLNPIQERLGKDSIFVDTNKVNDYSRVIENELIKNFEELGIYNNQSSPTSDFLIDNEDPSLTSNSRAINKIKQEIELSLNTSEQKTAGNIINNTVNNVTSGGDRTPMIIPQPRKNSDSALERYLDKISNFL